MNPRKLVRAIPVWLGIALASSAAAQPACKPIPEEHIYRQTSAGPMKAYVFRAQRSGDKAPGPAMIVLHGGGWSIGEPSWGFWLGERYSCQGMVVVVAQYRLSDGASVTPVDAVDDTRHVLSWTRRNAATFSLDPGRIAALGWSAGAHLAASAAALPGGSPESSPNLLLLVSPAVSVTGDAHFQALLGKSSNVSDWSPAEHVRPGLPPTVMVIGRADTVTPLAGATLFHDRMLAAGNVSVLHVYDGVGHLFTPASKRDDRQPEPDETVQRQAYGAIDRFLADQGYLAAKPAPH